MTEYKPRQFTSDAEIEHIGEGLLARTLPRAEWTHEAHLAATTYLLTRRPEVDIDAALPGIIRSYNESVAYVGNDLPQVFKTDDKGKVSIFGARAGTEPTKVVADSGPDDRYDSDKARKALVDNSQARWRKPLAMTK